MKKKAIQWFDFIFLKSTRSLILKNGRNNPGLPLGIKKKPIELAY
jgi:hypothetical protein